VRFDGALEVEVEVSRPDDRVRTSVLWKDELHAVAMDAPRREELQQRIESNEQKRGHPETE
jgi:hypothetical protein